MREHFFSSKYCAHLLMWICETFYLHKQLSSYLISTTINSSIEENCHHWSYSYSAGHSLLSFFQLCSITIYFWWLGKKYEAIQGLPPLLISIMNLGRMRWVSAFGDLNRQQVANKEILSRKKKRNMVLCCTHVHVRSSWFARNCLLTSTSERLLRGRWVKNRHPIKLQNSEKVKIVPGSSVVHRTNEALNASISSY